MLLKNLIKYSNSSFKNIYISGISFDSRKTKKNYIYVAIKGEKFDRNKYINHAINNGAIAVIYSGKVKKNNKAVFIKVKNTRKVLARISTRYFKSKPRNIVAVTGTNGKTSVCDFFNQIFCLQNKKSGYIGTLGLKNNKILKKRDLTTQDSLNLNKDLENLKKNGINNVIIEASSHGLKQNRLDFLKIKTGVFTNFSHDHLDYHKSMKDYLNSKLILFRELILKNGNVITDTDIIQHNKLEKIKNERKLKFYSIGSKSNSFHILNHKIYKDIQILELKYKKKIYKLKINLYGSIQVKNLLMAILAAKTCGLNTEITLSKIDRIKSIRGRLQLIRSLPNQARVFLDYAHTPDALEQAILSLREHFQKKITIIFGCGGDRDKSKRKLMGMVAKKYCDKIYITDDNPRNENPSIIRKNILKGLKGSLTKEISNRKKAIKYALKQSQPNEIILIAGKGHENYQDLGKKKIFFSDTQVVKDFKFIKRINSYENNEQNNANILKKVLNFKKNYFFKSISINSKKIKDKSLFVAIKGKNQDGHNFIKEALFNGANSCVVSKTNMKKSKTILVKNTMDFLYNLAKAKREHSSSKFIGITGSSGKTTVKTMLGKLLKKYGSTFYSPLSYNNHFGVPLSLCNTSEKNEFAVFEIGMSKKNEIFKLSKLVKPHIATITNISEAHMENFKNLKGIARAKSEIIYNIAKGGTVVLNRDDKFFNFLYNTAKKNKIKVKSFGYSRDSNVRLMSIIKKKTNYLLNISLGEKKLLLKTKNRNKNYIMNILCCLTVIEELNLGFEEIKNFFQKNYPLKGRGKINKVKKFNKKFFLIDESYNANPSSVKTAIDNFSNYKKKNKKKYFLFGDMLELGKNSNFYHRKVSNLINKSDIDKTFVYGKKACETFKFLRRNKKGEIINDLKTFDFKISQILNNGDFLMIKGSNGTKLHEVSKRFIKGRSNAL